MMIRFLMGALAALFLVGCGGNHGSLIYIDGCETAPLSDFLYEYCVSYCEEDSTQEFCEEICDYDPTLAFCDPGTGGTGGDGGTAGSGGIGGDGGTGGIGGNAGAGGEGGTGGTTPECRCDADCPRDGNTCTTDECVDGVCVHNPRPVDTECEQNGNAGVCDETGTCLCEEEICEEITTCRYEWVWYCPKTFCSKTGSHSCCYWKLEKVYETEEVCETEEYVCEEGYSDYVSKTWNHDCD